MPRVDWKQIEDALVHIVKGMGYETDENRQTGNKFVTDPHFDLTELAKDLEKELER